MGHSHPIIECLGLFWFRGFLFYYLPSPLLPSPLLSFPPFLSSPPFLSLSLSLPISTAMYSAPLNSLGYFFCHTHILSVIHYNTQHQSTKIKHQNTRKRSCRKAPFTGVIPQQTMDNICIASYHTYVSKAQRDVAVGPKPAHWQSNTNKSHSVKDVKFP